MNHMHHYTQPDQKFLNKIAFLDSKQREHLIPPEALISQMPIQKNHTLLDVGAGSGQSKDLENILLTIGFDVVKKTKINDAVYTVLAVKNKK